MSECIMEEDHVKAKLEDGLEIIEDGKTGGFLILDGLGHEHLEARGSKAEHHTYQPVQVVEGF